MAQSLETLRNNVLTSIYGRRLGLQRDESLVGPIGLKQVIEDIQTTVPTTVLAYGITRILTSGSSQLSQHLLPAPIPGIDKTIILQTTSTGMQMFLSTANGAAIISASDGTTKAVLNMNGPGGSVTLVGLTTALWGVKSWAGSSAGGGSPTYTTST